MILIYIPTYPELECISPEPMATPQSGYQVTPRRNWITTESGKSHVHGYKNAECQYQCRNGLGFEPVEDRNIKAEPRGFTAGIESEIAAIIESSSARHTRSYPLHDHVQ
jgi:hypothetical protein